ncbi:hypothetical protein BDD12DRAFT_817509 [Trichophaea hybrida]|nr:hypothetical protein BDD12DRAFT_817509 [Trichophaea hybrida]
MSIDLTNPSDNLTSITSHGFTYNPSTGALIGDASRDPESRIRALLFPHLIPTLIKGKRAQKQAEKEARRLTKKWISAQHKHYGLPFKATAKVDDLRASLIAALEARKLKSPPAAVQEILKGLEEEYKRKNAAHLAAVNKTRHEAFAALTDPIDAANYNFKLFLRRYFLDSTGRLDIKKAPAAMDLCRVRDRLQLAAAAKEIPGLHVDDAHDDGAHDGPFYNILVVGKDQKSVRDIARIKVEEIKRERRQADIRRELEVASLKERFEREKEQTIKQLDDDFRPLMESHFALVKSLPKPSTTASVANAKGTFHIRCPEIEGSWPDTCYDGLTLVIRDDPERTNTSGGPCLRGDFEFGVLSGIMHFWLPGEDWQTDYDGPDEDSSDEEYEFQSLNKKRRKPTASRGPVSKKRAVAADSRKLHFLWRGRESGEGEIQVDYQNTNKGCIEFRDNTFTVFDATWSADLLGDDIKFCGHKTSASGKGNGIRWGELGEKAYRRAEISRW